MKPKPKSPLTVKIYNKLRSMGVKSNRAIEAYNQVVEYINTNFSDLDSVQILNDGVITLACQRVKAANTHQPHLLNKIKESINAK